MLLCISRDLIKKYTHFHHNDDGAIRRNDSGGNWTWDRITSHWTPPAWDAFLGNWQPGDDAAKDMQERDEAMWEQNKK